MTGPEFFTEIILVILAVSFVLAFIRLVKGPSLPDRVVSLDLICTAGVTIAGAYAIVTGNTVFLDVAIVVALISFVGTVAFSTYVISTVARRNDR